MATKAKNANSSVTPRSSPSAEEPLSIIAHDGSLEPGAVAPVDNEAALDAFRQMLLGRLFDERATNLQRQGRLGTFSAATGQEASIVGSAMALDPARDWIVPQYRELLAMVRQGYSLESFLLYFSGNPVGGRIADGVNLMPFQIALGAQVPHAVGLAWGLRAQGRDGVVLTYFGDGASSEGDVHEAMNLAGVQRAPVVFLLQNNGWAISTPVRLQTAAETFACRASGYGFVGELVDGCDLFAVYDATVRGVERARAGQGPTLIESRCYRLGPHNTADDPTRYIDPDEAKRRQAFDPIARLRRYLNRLGILDDATEAALTAELKREINDAVAAAEGHPPASSGQMFDHVYANPPLRVKRQREAWAVDPLD